MTSRSIRKLNAIYRKGLHQGYRLGLEAAEREARICAISWDGGSSVAAGVVADQIKKLEAPDEQIQGMVDSRENEGGDVG